MTISKLLTDKKKSQITLLTEKEAAKLVNKSVYWLRRQRLLGKKSNSIPYRKLGGSIRYAEIDVLDWIYSHPLQISNLKTCESPLNRGDEHA